MHRLHITILTLVFLMGSARADIGVERDAQAVAAELGQQYLDIRVAPKEALQSQIDQLNARLLRLAAINDNLTNVDSLTEKSAKQYRAIAWLHGWAAFSTLITVSRSWINTAQRWQLLDLQTPSALRMLLDTYGQLVGAAVQVGGTVDRPLLSGPSTNCDRCFEMTYLQPLLPGDQKPQADGRYYVPATAELLGQASDRTQLNRNFLSLWALLNLEIDDWQSFDGKQNRLDAEATPPLVKWLLQWEVATQLRAIDGGASLTLRIEKLRAFLEFRGLIANPETLENVVRNIKSCRISTKYRFADPVTDPERAIARLRLAATPVHGERLHDAAIWLRYIFFLNYQDEGSGVLFGSLGITKEWNDFFGQDGDFASLLTPAEGASIAPPGSFMRWNQTPAPDGYSRALADLTQAAFDFLRAQNARLGADPIRLQSQQVKALRDTYASRLDKLRADLDRVVWRVAPHVVGQPLPAYASRDALWLVPARGAWPHSATLREQRTLSGDLSAVANLARQTRELTQLAYLACTSELDSDMTAVLKALSRTVSLHGWDITQVPSQSFKAYSEQAENALAAIRTGNAGADEIAELVRDFNDRLAIFNDAAAELQINKLGAGLALSVQKLAETEIRLARIDGKIAALRTEIARRGKDKANEEALAASQTLQQATRLNELATARVQALNAAYGQAQEVVAAAASELNNSSSQLRDAAKNIRTEKARGAFFSVLKTVITIVGAAVAPFTGGASLTVAQVAVGLTDVIRIAADKSRWKDFNSAVGAVAEITTVAGQSAAIGLKQWGTDKQKTDFDALRKQLSSGIKQVKQTADTVKLVQQLYAGLQQKADFPKMAALLAAGFPTRFKDGQLTIDVAAEQVHLKLPAAFQDALAAAVDVGATLKRDAAVASSSVATARELINDGIHQIEPALLAAASGGAVNDYLTRFGDAKKRMLVAYDALSPAEQEQVSRLLDLVAQRGMAVVRSADGTLTALQRRYLEDLQGLEDEIKTMQAEAVHGAIGQVVAKVVAEQKQLSSMSAAATDDPDQLEAIARDEVPRSVDRVKDALHDLQAEINKARMEASMRQENLDISTHLNNAANINSEILDDQSEVAGLDVERSGEVLNRAMTRKEQAETSRQMSELQLSRSGMRVAAAQADMLFAYQRALAHGINPINGVPSNTLIGIRRLLRMAVPPAHRENIRLAGQALFGMIQWIALLRPRWQESVTARGTPLDYYGQLITAMIETGRGDRATTAVLKLTDLKDGMDTTYGALVATAPAITLCANPTIGSAELPWVLAKGQWIARLPYRMWLGSNPLPSKSGIEDHELGPDDRLYLARLKPTTMENVYVFMHVPKNRNDDPTSFSYSVTPPVAGRLSRRSLIASANPIPQYSASAVVRRNIAQVIFEADTKKTILGPDIKELPYLLPAEGTWQLELRVSGERSSAWVRDPARRFELQFYCLEINPQ